MLSFSVSRQKPVAQDVPGKSQADDLARVRPHGLRRDRDGPLHERVRRLVRCVGEGRGMWGVAWNASGRGGTRWSEVEACRWGPGPDGGGWDIHGVQP